MLCISERIAGFAEPLQTQRQLYGGIGLCQRFSQGFAGPGRSSGLPLVMAPASHLFCAYGRRVDTIATLA